MEIPILETRLFISAGYACAVLLLALLYVFVYRPWQLSWGARTHERKMKLPGDEVVSSPDFNATRAVTVHAPPECIYPWLVQMGLGRAGWYSYDLLDNLARPSAEEILPQFQHIEIGDLIPMSPDGKQGIRVRDFSENKWMLWWDDNGRTTWVWKIIPLGPDHSRLLTRVRTRYQWFKPAFIFDLLIEFADFPMMRKCMLGIKKRAEKLASAGTDSKIIAD